MQNYTLKIEALFESEWNKVCHRLGFLLITKSFATWTRFSETDTALILEMWFLFVTRGFCKVRFGLSGTYTLRN